LLVLPAAVRATDQTIELGGGKAVILNLPEGWKLTSGDGSGATTMDAQIVQLTPDNGANAAGLIRVELAPDEHFADHTALREALQTTIEPLIPGSVEKKAGFREFKSPHGFGYAVTFTDPTLVGKPPESGNYKTETFLLLALSDQVVVRATLLADDLKGPEYESMLAMIRSLAVRKKSDRI